MTTATTEEAPMVQKQSAMEAKIIEMVQFELNEGVSREQGKAAMEALNNCVMKFPGFVGRKTSISEDGQFLDLVYWSDLQSARTASEQVMKDESLIPHFAVIKEETMVFKHFEIFINK